MSLRTPARVVDLEISTNPCHRSGVRGRLFKNLPGVLLYKRHMSTVGVEPTRPFDHTDLNRARLPDSSMRTCSPTIAQMQIKNVASLPFHHLRVDPTVPSLLDGWGAVSFRCYRYGEDLIIIKPHMREAEFFGERTVFLLSASGRNRTYL